MPSKQFHVPQLVRAGVVAVVLIFGSTTGHAQTLRIKFYSQNDSTWAKDWLGGTKLTIGSHGCLLTCVAATLRVTPRELNAWLTTNGGYDASGNLRHDKAAAYDGAAGLQYSGRGRLSPNASAVGRGIARGAVYIARSSKAAEHWVLIYKSNGSQSYYLDPIDGTTNRVGDKWVKYGAEARIYSLR